MEESEKMPPFENNGVVANDVFNKQGLSPSAGSPPKRRFSPNLLFKPSRAYLAEYAVLLIITGSLLGLINSMFGSILDYLGAYKTSPRFGGDFAYTASIATLAGVIVLVPALVALTKRTGLAEAENRAASKLSWRKGFLAIFLVMAMLTTLCYGVAFVYEILSRIASAGLGTANKPGLWRPLIKYGFALALFGFTAWLYAKDYRSEEDFSSQHSFWRRIHRYVLSLIALILAIVFVIWPLRVQRNHFIDATIVNDLNLIKYKITDYESSKRALPRQLSDLNLNDEQKAHVKAYGYEYKRKGSTSYELCGIFKTDTRDKQPSSANPLERFSGSSYDYSSTNERDPDPSIHDKGRACFTYRTSRAIIDDNFNESNDSDLNSDSYLQD